MIEYGRNNSIKILNSLDNYAVVTQAIPWEKWSKNLSNQPSEVIYNSNMEESHLEQLAKDKKGNYSYIVGLGGGVACDTGKYLSMKWSLPLITIPSIISVDAFLCEEIGVRNQNRVRYIGSSKPEKIIIDYDLIRTAPAYLNYAGVGDVLSCTTALGDWIIARDLFGDDFDQSIFKKTVILVKNLLASSKEIHSLSDEGIKMIVESLQGEVFLSKSWGNARPEEGSEHFLAYALEKLTPRSYIHGSLISLNCLVVLRLQGKYAVFEIKEIKDFLDKVQLKYAPNFQNISKHDYKMALKHVQQYTKEEKLFHGLWYLRNPFREASIDEIIEWVYNF